MRRLLVTGTDTGVGKTRVTAAIALAARALSEAVTIVKIAQTGVQALELGDAAHAGALAGVAHVELARFTKPADPWAAALAQGEEPLRAQALAEKLCGIEGTLVAEGSGGLLVPLGPGENFGTLAGLAGLEVVLAVGLRLGCINHALLTLEACRTLGLHVAGTVLVDCWQTSDDAYVADVRRPLQGKTDILGILPFESDEPASVRHAAGLFTTLVT